MKTDLKFAALIASILLVAIAFAAKAMHSKAPGDRAIAEGLRLKMSPVELGKLLNTPVALRDQSKGDPSRPYVFEFSTYQSNYQSYSIFTFFFDSKKQLKEVLERYQSPGGDCGLRDLPLK